MWISSTILNFFGFFIAFGLTIFYVSGSVRLSELTTDDLQMFPVDVLDSVRPLTSAVCWNFSVGNRDLGELFSPNYGQNYPSRTECVQLISAPNLHRVRLDFRNEFHIEPSEDCGNDHLEIRDGPFGYSPLLGRFCGSRRPPLIESSGRHLWLRFYSDDSIEYRGFRAAYQFYRSTVQCCHDEACRIDVVSVGNDGFASESDVPPEFRSRSNETKVPLDCTWIVQAPSPHQTVLLRWQKYVMSTIHLCDDSFLEVYDGTTGQLDRRHTFCDSTARDIRSKTNTLYLRLYASSVEKMPYFTVLYTYLVPGPCENDASLFDCGDKTCIDRALLCNSRFNCNTSRDETQCNNTTQLLNHQEVPGTIRYHTLIIGVVGGIVLTITILAICAVYRQSNKDRQLRRHLAATSSLCNNTQRFELTDLSNIPVAPTPLDRRNSSATDDLFDDRNIAQHGEVCSLTANHYESRRFRRLSNGGRPKQNATSRLCEFVDSTDQSNGNTSTGPGFTDKLLRCSQDLDNDMECERIGQRIKASESFHEAVYCPAQNIISAVATIEKLPSSPSVPGATRDSWASRRDSTPSPRPDVVQDEKFFPVTFGKNPGKRGSAPSPPVRRLPPTVPASVTTNDGKRRDTKKGTTCGRTCSTENCGEMTTLHRDLEVGRSYRKLDFDSDDPLGADRSSNAFVRFSPDWSASVTLRRPPFPREYTGLESTSARSAPSLILPLRQNNPTGNAYGSFYPGSSVPPESLMAATSNNRPKSSASSVPPPTNAASTIHRAPVANTTTVPPDGSTTFGTSIRGGFTEPAASREGANTAESKGTRSTTSFSRTEPQSRSRRRSKSPDIFYTRPNRGILKNSQ